MKEKGACMSFIQDTQKVAFGQQPSGSKRIMMETEEIKTLS